MLVVLIYFYISIDKYKNKDLHNVFKIVQGNYSKIINNNMLNINLKLIYLKHYKNLKQLMKHY